MKRFVFKTSATAVAQVARGLVLTTSAIATAEVAKRPAFTTQHTETPMETVKGFFPQPPQLQLRRL